MRSMGCRRGGLSGHKNVTSGEQLVYYSTGSKIGDAEYSETAEWEVEKILHRREAGNKTVEYLVRLLGWGEDEDSWGPGECSRAGGSV